MTKADNQTMNDAIRRKAGKGAFKQRESQSEGAKTMNDLLRGKTPSDSEGDFDDAA